MAPFYNWRASETSETLSGRGNKWKSEIYLYLYIINIQPFRVEYR